MRKKKKLNLNENLNSVNSPSPMVVVPIRYDKFELRDGTEKLYGGKVVAYGNQEACEAAAKLLSPGNWKLITCVTPNGRIDGHFSYVRGGHLEDGLVCAFCNKKQ